MKQGKARRATQKQISFPVLPEDINREMLTPPNAATTSDDDGDTREANVNQAYDAEENKNSSFFTK